MSDILLIEILEEISKYTENNSISLINIGILLSILIDVSNFSDVKIYDNL